MKTETLTHLILTILIGSILLHSCGTLHKKQSLQQSSEKTEITSSHNEDMHISQETSRWLQSWIEKLHYSNTLIHSDSTITYLPGGGFQLNKGMVAVSELKQQTATNQETLSGKEQVSSQNHQQQAFSMHQDEINQQHEKERSPTIPLKWLILISFIALLSPLLLHRYNNRKL